MNVIIWTVILVLNTLPSLITGTRHTGQIAMSTGGVLELSVQPFPAWIRADMNADGSVSEEDAQVFWSHYGSRQNESDYVPEADWDSNGSTDLKDLISFLGVMDAMKDHPLPSPSSKDSVFVPCQGPGSTVLFVAHTVPSGYEQQIRWEVNGVEMGLGSRFSLSTNRPGSQTLTAQIPGTAAQSTRVITAFSTRIANTGVFSLENGICQYDFSAQTDPSTCSDLVFWSAHSQTGNVSPSFGFGKQFSVRLKNTASGGRLWLMVQGNLDQFLDAQETLDTLTVSVDSTGTAKLPDYISRIMASDRVRLGLFGKVATGPLVINQIPPPGTVIGTERTQVIVAFQARDEVDLHLDCHVFVVNSVDLLPPKITISGLTNGTSVVTPAQLKANIVVHDESQGTLLIHAVLDTLPYTSNSPITAIGSHVLRVSASDQAGNWATAAPISFEILPRPRYSATAVVAAYQCSESQGHATTDIEVYLASGSFDVKGLNLYTVNCWPLNSQGMNLNQKKIFVTDAIDPLTGAYDYTHVQAQYRNGYWDLHFHVLSPDTSLIGCPTTLEITGSGRNGLSGSFDFRTTVVAQVNPDPIGTLLLLGLINGDPVMAPPQEPQWPPCRWKEEYTVCPTDQFHDGERKTCLLGDQRWRMDIFAQGADAGGTGSAEDNCLGDAQESKAVHSCATYRLWLEGPETCCNCRISCSYLPSFKARATLDRPGEAIACGDLHISSACASARAIGGVQVGGVHARKITFGFEAGANKKEGPSVGVKIETEMVWEADKLNQELVFSDSGANDLQACMLTIAISSSVHMEVLADDEWEFGIFGNKDGKVTAAIVDWSPGIKVVARCQQPNSPCGTVTFTK